MSYMSTCFVSIYKSFGQKHRNLLNFPLQRCKRLFLVLIIILCTSGILLKWHFSSNDLDPFDFPAFRYAQDQKILKVLASLESSSLHSSTNETDHGWREIYPQVYVYSAYDDECTVLTKSFLCIKIIGAINEGHSFLDSEVKKQCCLRDSRNVTWETELSIEILPEHHSKYFRSTFFYCFLKKEHYHLNFTHFYLKFPNPMWADSTSWLPINKQNNLMLHSKGQNQGLSVCIRPLFNNFSSPLALSEFIGYYQALGVDHFIFYNLSISPQIKTYFSLLDPSSTTISLRQWNLPIDTNSIHSEGQIAHVNDCLLFSKHYFNHTIFVDLDEFIMPYKHSSLPNLILYLKRNFPKAGSYIIRSVMFCNEFLHKDVINISNASLALISQTNFLRQKNRFPYKERSKVIANPGAISLGGIHFMWNHTQGVEEALVESSLVTLNHYRQCGNVHFTYFNGFIKIAAVRDTIVEDRNMLRFRENLLSSTAIRFLSSLWIKVPN